MPRLKFDLQPLPPWRGTVEEHNTKVREIYAHSPHLVAPCTCGYHVDGVLCSCPPRYRDAEAGRVALLSKPSLRASAD